MGHFFNAIHHHDRCRLVHPAKWDIRQFRVAFMTDSVGESRHSVYRFNSRCQELTNLFTIQLITRMQLIVNISNITFSNPYALSLYNFKYHISNPYALLLYYFKDILIPYNHFRFIWYTTKTLEIRIEVNEQTEAIDSHFLPFDLGPRFGDPHPSLVNNNYATLSG